MPASSRRWAARGRLATMGHLILVRHSTTDAITSGRNLGQASDPPLNADGLARAARLGQALAAELEEMPVDTIRTISSPAQRCRQTLAAIASALPAGVGAPPEPEIEPAIVEIDYGAWEGLTAAQCEARDPALRRAWEADPYATRAPGGESGADVAARAFPVFAAIEAWLAGSRGRGAVVVAHNHVNRLRLAALLAWPMSAYRRRLAQEPAAYSVITFGDAAPIVRRVGVQPH